MAGGLISRQAALAKSFDIGIHSNVVSAYDIATLPAVDAVPVVRCKDCRDGGHCEMECLLCEVDKIPDPYCAAGKRREEDAKPES